MRATNSGKDERFPDGVLGLEVYLSSLTQNQILYESELDSLKILKPLKIKQNKIFVVPIIPKVSPLHNVLFGQSYTPVQKSCSYYRGIFYCPVATTGEYLRKNHQFRV